MRPVTGSPVASEIHGMRGSAKRTARAASRSGAAAPAISGEWKACETASGRTTTPLSWSRARAASVSSRAPDRTSRPGPLTAATETEANPSATERITSAGPEHASIAPSPGCSSMCRPRTAARVSASSSDRTPATHAAPYAPMLWPSSAAGRTPSDVHSSARATSSATRAGWQYRVEPSRAAPSSANSSSGSGSRRYGRSTASARSRVRAKPPWVS